MLEQNQYLEKKEREDNRGFPPHRCRVGFSSSSHRPTRWC